MDSDTLKLIEEKLYEMDLWQTQAQEVIEDLVYSFRKHQMAFCKIENAANLLQQMIEEEHYEKCVRIGVVNEKKIK